MTTETIIITNEDDFSCSTNSTDDNICHIICNTFDLKASGTISCGSAETCIIDCNQQKCFKDATINANEGTKHLTINFDGNQCGRTSTFILPNGGNATINGISSIKGALNNAIFVSDQTDHIWVKCEDTNNDASTAKNQCKGMEMDATDAQFLQVDLIGVEYEEQTDGRGAIYCPVNSSYNGPESSSCIMNAESSLIENIDIYAVKGTPQDFIFNSYGGNIINGLNLICGSSYSTEANVSNNDGSFVNTDCFITKSPTENPTNSPTFTPSFTPSISNPTHSPTFTPSLSSSISNPTHFPTIKPSMAISTESAILMIHSPTSEPTGIDYDTATMSTLIGLIDETESEQIDETESNLGNNLVDLHMMIIIGAGAGLIMLCLLICIGLMIKTKRRTTNMNNTKHDINQLQHINSHSVISTINYNDDNDSDSDGDGEEGDEGEGDGNSKNDNDILSDGVFSAMSDEIYENNSLYNHTLDESDDHGENIHHQKIEIPDPPNDTKQNQ